MNDSFKKLSFVGHLEELRKRLVISIVSFTVGCIIFYTNVDCVLRFIVRPVGKIIFTAPSEAFVARMSLTFIGGFILASPIIFYQLWMFIAAGLTEKEKRYALLFVPLSVVCFLSGVAFAYTVIVPISLKFFLSFSNDYMVAMITVDKYISFVTNMLISFGIVFELPLILMFLARVGIATPEFLRHYRRHAIIVILIISAILTPPDVVSLLLMAGPLIVLYELGIFACKFVVKK